ncbi:hypothetical protein DL240_13105 [Lujinxingia litoralis]|uniref:Big-1 domain-containing protein n=1 Tax=Lujinxingia litoralis TaxID=2211119 RepID=A0A328C412_9DELT|nr:hypothetical protein [Lujinxingia litoralis]RAL21784.1 hypothetical protein DL240_13105 [Lujinxingia litoralis]
MTRTSTYIVSLLALALLTGVGCGESSVHYNSGDDVTRVGDNTDRDPPDTGNPHAQGYTLRVVGDAASETYLGQTARLQTILVDDQDQPVADESITFEILADTGSPDVRLQSRAVITNEQGLASNLLVVGDLFGTLRVRASHPGANAPVEFVINITDAPTGDLRVGVDYSQSDLAPLSMVQVRLWDSVRHPCSTIPTFLPPADAPVHQADLLDITEMASFDAIDPTHRFTAVVYGRGAFDQIMAFGCLDDVSAEPEAITDVVVTLDLLHLMSTGVYNVESYWDFREAISSTGAIGSTIVGAIEAISNPGRAIADLAVDWAQDWVCDNRSLEECAIALAFGGEARDTIEEFINEQLSRMQFFEDLMAIGQDLNDTISQMKVESILTISNKQVGEGELRGVDSWRAMNFYWRRNCTDTSPADCGEIRFGLGSGSTIGALESEWDGRLADYNRLEIDAHELTVPYGLVILEILNNTLIPAMTGGNANSISGALNYWICDNLGTVTVAGINLPIGGVCSSLVAPLISTYANQFLADLDFSINLFVEGEGLMYDTDSDGQVDLIDEGIFHGEIRRDNGPPTQMEASFEGTRQP